MSKLVIVTSDLLKCKDLINNCIGKISSLQIIGILTCNSELEYFKKKVKFDFLLYHNLNFTETEKVNYDIICINKYKVPVRKSENRICISSLNTFEKIKKHLEKFTNKVASDLIRQKASEILLKLGFNFKHVGTQYIIDAVCYSCLNNFDNSFENLEKSIYPYVAKINNTQVVNVKWSITRTINMMYLNHTTKTISVLEEYFCLDHFQKPTPKQVIGMIKNKILYSNSNKNSSSKIL